MNIYCRRLVVVDGYQEVDIVAGDSRLQGDVAVRQVHAETETRLVGPGQVARQFAFDHNHQRVGITQERIRFLLIEYDQGVLANGQFAIPVDLHHGC